MYFFIKLLKLSFAIANHCINNNNKSLMIIYMCNLQMNQVSHFLDGSTIYGSSLVKSRELRTFEGGRLRVDVHDNQEYLPHGSDELKSQCGENCYNSGN